MEIAQSLFRIFHDKGEELYLVGGYVRDLLLGRATGDYDFATSALPDVTRNILESGGFKAIPIGMEFGTVATFLYRGSEKTEVQITTYRCRESYRKGSRHPDVVFGKNLEEDLTRRDFTINAMAMSEEGMIIDPLGGRWDLENGIIRTPLEPDVTFREDPLRMLRAFRFACRLGFSLHPSVLDTVTKLHTEIMNISRERWKLEMDLILTAPDGNSVADTLQAMKESGILTDMIPQFEEMFTLNGVGQGKAHCTDIWNHTLEVIRHLQSTDKCLRWAALLHDIGKSETRMIDDGGDPHFYRHEEIGAFIATGVAECFRFSKKERSCVNFLVKNHMRPVLYSKQWSDRAVRKLIRDSGEYLERLIDLSSADIAAHSTHFAEDGSKRLRELRIRLNEMIPDSGERILPKELGQELLRMAGSDPVKIPEISVILSNIEELVHEGVLPAMAQVRVYMDYLIEHPEIRERNC
ncbi:MAG: HDIG domain-containing protein [Candidatus Aegiribacteria sp.]|nr:HDIG domain-containing protein [Candidatus Aegiribacteria sp.]